MEQKLTITLKDVAKDFGARTLFSSVNCQVRSGECLVITGGNGTGKTTLIKIIARLIRPSAGHIEMTIGGTRLKDSEESLPYIGLVSPEIILYDQLTATENISMLAQMRDIAPGTEEIERSLNAVGLGADNNRHVKTYSTGMRQRLKFALLKAINPPVWLIDEGLSNLDNDGRGLVLSLIENALSQNRLIVLATNEQAEVKYASKTIALPQY